MTERRRAWLAGARSVFTSQGGAEQAGRLGMWIFLISVGVLFLSAIVGVVVIRVQAQHSGRWPNDLPALPGGVWTATLALGACSGMMLWAEAAARRNAAVAMRTAMVLSMACAAAFLFIQGGTWVAWLEALGARWNESRDVRLAVTGFHVLTGLHAAHAAGGGIPLGVTMVRALRGAYTAQHHGGLQMCAAYWHFMGAMWAAVLITLLAVR